MGKRSRDKGKRRGRRTDVAARSEAVLAPTDPGPGTRDAEGRRRDDGLPPTADITELAARWASLGTALQRQIGRSDAGSGLTRARLSALTLLVLGGPRTLGGLAAAEHVRPPTMTRLVHAMEAEGLVVREANPGDGRSVVIRATVGAEALLAEGRARQLAPLATAMGGLDAAERRDLEEAAELLGRVLRDTSRNAVDPIA